MEGNEMKILMTADSLGGVWTYSLELCRELAQYNVQVHLVVMGATLTAEQNKAVDNIPNVTLYQGNFKLEWMQDPWQDVDDAKKWLKGIYDSVQPDLIHFNNYGQVDFDWKCPIITVFHSDVQTWWKAVKGESAPEEWQEYKNRVQSALWTSDVAVFPSQAIHHDAEEVYGKIVNSVIIYNGIQQKTITTNPKDHFIFSVGRLWDEAKNIKLITQLEDNLDWPISVAGNNINPSTGERINFGNIRFLGQIAPDEVSYWMNHAAIFVSPAKYEPFGLAILEAATSGCTLVLSNISTLKEIWGDAAVYVDPNNPKELKEELTALMNNPQKRFYLAEKAKERAQNFTAKQMGENYFQLYKQLLSHSYHIQDSAETVNESFLLWK